MTSEVAFTLVGGGARARSGSVAIGQRRGRRSGRARAHESGKSVRSTGRARVGKLESRVLSRGVHSAPADLFPPSKEGSKKGELLWGEVS